ncbi:breast cancer type 2 susceptibility protein [Fundulus heteroclitus]|uniref:breast cancer type 2 susceptibility protein n=1 Tax=Fundulus heteroclitus TaxID=8078 RepID=UPI00165A8CFB|nr:breast cancer type 2 susceptibility protein [Fundulus heteroclitus]
MYDAFKDVIWKELGLLDPNWFEVQATQASLDEGNGVDSFDLRANQEGIFKTPLEKTATESQLFSTPKVFRHSRIVSPDTEDEPPFIVAHEKETLPWMATQSPCLFQPSKQSVSDVKCEGVQAQSEESFDFLATPKKSPDTYVKHISESLGAHINPDISWTSSLNTPPGLPGSTLILSKKDESPCPVNVTAERNGFLVRKLFPSLSNSSPKTWKKSAVSSSSQSAVLLVADGCPESPLNQSESHWQQKVPDAVAGEEEVCSADGAETVPSNFFANSSSALRKVKLNRVKRKQIIQTNVDVCVHGDVSKADNGASSEEAAAEMESGALPSTPQVKTGYTAISQWSPLNLSQISSCAVGSSMTSPAVTDSDQVTKPSVKTTDSGFIRKKRTFVYAVAATKSQAQCQDSEFQKMDPSPKISDSEQEMNTKSLENTPGKAESQRTKNQNEFAGEPKTQFLGSKLQDVDMSQLCRDFAQDFSQMTDVKLAEGTQSNFSPAACLSAMKQAKQKAKQANLPNDHSNNRHIPTSSVTEETMTDSGLQSGIADVTHETSLSFALTCLEKVGQNGHLFDVKTKMHNFQSTTGSGNEKVDAELPLPGSRKGQTLDHGKETNLHMESTSTRQSRSRDKTVDESNCAEPAGTPVSLLFSNESGFKTASNKGIHISPANLERAKRLLEETEDAKTFRDHSCKTYHAVKYKGNSSPETMKNIPTNSTQPLRVEKSFGNISSQLTASEKADVKELCVLLEEADSQFEFTQFKPAKIMQNGQDDHNHPEKQDKDLDPAFLADIDFDDSFSSDGGKQPAVAVVSDKTTSVSESITNEETAKATNHCTEMSVSNLLKKENSSLDYLSESITKDRICLKSVEPDILPRTEGTEASMLENNSTLTHGETFRTAGGSVLKVSKTCLSKARALFADLENNLTDQKPSDKQNRGNASKTEQKCDIDSDVCGKDLGFTLKETCDVGKEIDNCFSKLDGVACSNKNVPSVGDKSDGKGLKNNQIDTTACESGFRRASGKGISISAKYMQEAEAFFKDCHAMGHGEDKKIKALPESAASKKSFTNFKSPQVSISKESVAGCAKFENVNAALIAHHTKGLRLAEVETKSRFTAALKHEDGKPFSTSKPFAVIRTSNSMASSALENVCSGDGFCTAAGKNICVSAAAMRKAESLLNHIQTPEEINTQANQRELTSKTKGLHDEMSKLDNGCFETVGGKENKISSTAQKKAALLREYEKPEDEISVSPQHTDPEIPVTNLWSGGFLAASGKPVVLSSEALEKAKALFSDISLNMDNLSETAPGKRDRKPEEDQSNAEMLHSGFATAGAAKDHVSQKNILNARDHLKECDDLVLVKAMEEEDALFTDCDLGSNAMLASAGSKKGDLENPFPDQRIGINISEDAGKRCFRETNEQKQKENLLPQASCGFKTASGGRVDVSFEALKRAQTLLGDCVGVEDKVNAAPPESKAVAFPIRKGGFQSASGKPVVLSSEALRKAKSLFSDIGLSAEDPNASQTRKSCKNQDGGDNTETIWCGFTSARGERVDVSKKNLQKAQVLFKELDDLASTKAMQEEDAFFADCDAGISDEMLEKDTKGKANPIKHYQEEMRVDISMEAGCSRDADKRVEQNEKTLPQASRGFQTASGKRVDVSSEALKRAKTLLSEFEGLEDKTNTTALQSKATARPLRNVGFHSASGKPVALSTEALEKAKSLFGDITFSAEDLDSSQTMKTDEKQDSRNDTEKICCGFTTARGEKVSVSQKNIQTAKFLFKELDDLSLTRAMQETDNFFTEEGWTTDGKSEINQTNKAPVNESGSAERNVSQLTPDERETGRICEDPENGFIKAKEKEGSSLPAPNGGFHTASGKTVAVSCEALSRAKLLLSESKTDEERTSLPLSQTPINDLVLTNGGFSAASGKPLMFSSESLQKAKTLFSNINLTTALPHKGEEKWEGAQNEEKVKCALTNVEATNPVNSEIPNLRDLEGTSTPKSSLSSANRKKHSGVESRPRASSEGQRGGFVVRDLNTESSINTFKVKGTDESADPKLQSLNLAGCTETQEALDCMEALLEDEFLVGQHLLTTSDLLQQTEEQKSNCTSTEESRTRKRRCAEDLTAHPPSKRRLLEDFGRTTDGPSGSGLHSVKICPYGLMDRGVFKYSASLHPNVTKPPWDAKTFVDTRFQATTQTRRSDPGGDISGPSKMPAFVPPFIRNTKRDIPNKPEAADRKKAPAFVPPFKKHRSVPPESSAKQQDDGLRHPLSSECDSRTDAPGSTADVVPSADSANTSMTINQSVPGSMGPVSATETLHTDGVLSRSQDGTQNIELARDMQDMRIRKKKRQTIRPLPGSLFLTKTSGVMRIPLRAAVNGKSPARYSAQELYECGVHTQVHEVTGANAESFRFNLLQFIKQETLSDGGGVQLADGGWLIPSNDWTAGKEEFYRALCDTTGVDPKLISEQWVYNHYRWIVWKQASMERSFPAAMGSLCLTPEQVLLQLKYRYDVEVDHSRRPALRKIMERDDTPAKTLVLCVCDVVCRGHSLSAQSRSNTKTTQSAETKAETPFAVIWLTDGWYAIKAQLDEPLTAMLHKGLLAVGGKLMIHGAQLVGSQDACSPLEAPDSLMLKICGNSTRRARWDAKLGFHRDPRPFLLPISCLFSNGGPVGCVDIIVLRSYPMQWMERKSDGGVVFRSARAEEKEARRFDIHKQKAIERLFAKVQAEFEKEEEGSMKPQRRRQTISKQDLANLQDGVELYEAVGDDPAYLEAHLSEQQMESLQAYRRSLMEKKQAALQERYRRALDAEDSEMSCPKRDVTPVWRLCVADSTVQSSCVYQLNLWRPSSDLQSLLKEGCRFKVYNLVASDGKKRSSVDTVQLTGTKNTKFQELQAPQEWLSSRFQQRVSTDFVDLQNEEFKPLCGDVDLAGYVISVIDQQGSSPAFYLVDGKLDFVKVRCFSSLSQAGLEDVVKPRVLLALSNLQLRGQSMYPTPVVYAGDLTAFSTNPKEIHLQEAIYQLKNMVQCQDNFFRTAEDKLAHLVKSDDVRSPSLRQQTPASATDRRQDSKTSVSFQRPVKSLGSFTPVSSNVPAGPSSAEKDPKILKRRRALDYLSRIPSPPPVSPLASAVSPCVKKTFNPPRRSGPPSTLNPVQTAAPKPSDAAVEGDWVNDEELAMIDTQALHVGSLF